MSSLEQEIHEIGRQAKAASRRLAGLSAAQKNEILRSMADELELRSPALLEANAKDLSRAEESGLGKAAIDRLRLTDKRIAEMADGVRQVACLNDPVGEVLALREHVICG